MKCGCSQLRLTTFPLYFVACINIIILQCVLILGTITCLNFTSCYLEGIEAMIITFI